MSSIDSGAGTNLKVGSRVRKKCIVCRAPPLFGSTSRPKIIRFGGRFRGGQYSLVSFLFAALLYSRCAMCPAICKSEGGGQKLNL